MMNISTVVLKWMVRLCSSRFIRKKVCLAILPLLTLLTVLFFTFNIHYLCSLLFFSFDEMPKYLLPRQTYNSSFYNGVCSHVYETQNSKKKVTLNLNVSDVELNTLAQEVVIGGKWAPTCWSKYRVNIIVPYRQRPEQLRTFLHYIHRFLQLQEIDYHIFIVEQSKEEEFNRGKLFNVGFVEAQKRFPSDCYIFHDVDLIPLSLNNIYACTHNPRHLSSAVDEFSYKLPYCEIFGGAIAITTKLFEQVNGYSNLFYGWGGEDDDLYFRVSQAKMSLVRFGQDIAKYRMLSHSKETPNPERFKFMNFSRILHTTEGLNTLDYQLIGFDLKMLYTWFLIKL